GVFLAAAIDGALEVARRQNASCELSRGLDEVLTLPPQPPPPLLPPPVPPPVPPPLPSTLPPP
ncbi:MAG TPA: hypothetical protein VFF24_00360, partial [Acidimicrobiia bacterium]|nr:hypothetical protein [Acidimicrobiia bacterium]